MNTSSKFVVATHILAGLAGKKEYFCEGTVTKSEMLAESVNTNPVVIRRLLGTLNKAGLIISKSGPNGGAILAKNPSEITLDEIYSAVEADNEFFHFHYQSPSDVCPIGANIQQVLSKKLCQLNKVVEDYLSTITLKEILDEILEMSGIFDYLDEGFTAEQIEEMILDGEIEVKKG